MSVIKEVNIKITGQVPGDYQDRDYEVLIAKLNLIVAEYGLEMEEE
jgi:hypothetical protein